MADLIVGGILVAIVAAAALYIRKEKKKGVRCVGCPSAGTCGKQSDSSSCSCASHSK